MIGKYMWLCVIMIQVMFSGELLLQVKGKKKEYCFYKQLFDSDKIHFTYIVSSENKEQLKVRFYKSEDMTYLYSQDNEQQGEFKSQLLQPGIYALCFYPQERTQYHISFDYYSQAETGIVKEIAHDKEVKQMYEHVVELKTLFQDFEKNFKFLVDRRNSHTGILEDIVHSIKNLTFLKICIIALLSLFQVLVIQKFFGPDKRVSSVKGGFASDTL